MSLARTAPASAIPCGLRAWRGRAGTGTAGRWSACRPPPAPPADGANSIGCAHATPPRASPAHARAGAGRGSRRPGSGISPRWRGARAPFLLELLGQAAFALQLDGAHQRLLQVQRVARQHQRTGPAVPAHSRRGSGRRNRPATRSAPGSVRPRRQGSTERGDCEVAPPASTPSVSRYSTLENTTELEYKVQQRGAAPGQAGEEGDGAHVVPPLARVRRTAHFAGSRAGSRGRTTSRRRRQHRACRRASQGRRAMWLASSQKAAAVSHGSRTEAAMRRWARRGAPWQAAWPVSRYPVAARAGQDLVEQRVQRGPWQKKKMSESRISCRLLPEGATPAAGRMTHKINACGQAATLPGPVRPQSGASRPIRLIMPPFPKTLSPPSS